MLSEAEISELLGQFPEVDFAFAYGSGVVTQGGYDYSKQKDLPMLDLILVVEDSVAWHTANMARNPHHYSPLIPLNASGVTFVQERLKARFWFNTYVSANLSNQPTRQMKYGVIRKSHAVEDLLEWTDLYIAGRLHKPVQVLKRSASMEKAMDQNRLFAVQTSLLLLPERFHELELYKAIASLSYVGDPRMAVGENPNKVENLVTPIVPHYRALYESDIEKALALAESPTSADDIVSKPSSVSPFTPIQNPTTPVLTNHTTPNNIFRLSVSRSGDGFYTQDGSPTSRWQRCLQLPGHLRSLLEVRPQASMSRLSIPRTSNIRSALASIVSSSASVQTMKGLFTAGAHKSFVYAWNKVSKRFSGLPALATPRGTSK